MNSNTFSKGNILEASHRKLTKGYHYIIYFEGYSDIEFCGCMITHFHLNGNLKMENNHFETNDQNGNYYKITFDNTYLVKGKFIKSEEWGPFEKVGDLAELGIDFMNEHIEGLDFETFREYYIRNKFTK